VVAARLSNEQPVSKSKPSSAMGDQCAKTHTEVISDKRDALER
jgi:hypothetical protein